MNDTDTIDRPADPSLDRSSERPAERPMLNREERARLRLERYRRRRLIGWIVLAALVVLGGTATYLVTSTSVLGLRTVDVSLVTPTGVDDTALIGQIRQAVAVAVDDGTPLIRVDLELVRERVQTVSGVAAATVTRHWPGTLQISVTPRVPVAVVAANAQLYLMDATGYPYVVVDTVPPPLFTVRLATPGVGDPATMAALAVAQALPDELHGQIASVSATSPYHVTVELIDGRSVVWGSADRSAEKAQVLPAALGLPGTVYDLSDPEFIVTR